MATVATLFETMEYGPAPESDAPALDWIKQHDSGRFGHFINGKWTAPTEGQYFETINPATTAVLARVAQGSKADVDAAVQAANAAAPAWAGLPAHARARHLYALAREVQRHSRLLAVLESLDNGKPIRETRDLDIPLVARHFYHHAGWAQLRDSAFPGSTEVGRIIRKATAGSGKKLTLELGGKSPFIVFEDADLDSVVEGVVDAIWFNQGQVCCAGSRLLVQEGVADRLTQKLRARMEKLRVGSPLDKAVDMGAIVAPVQLERIRGLVEKGVEEGAKMWQPSWACPTEGYFYPPTLFTDVSPAATIAQVEIFGPVLVSMTFRTPKEAVELANNTPYGLAASVWSENINLALDVAPKLKAGVVWINSTNLFDAASGFGGYRESGFGREGGREGMWEYLKPEYETRNAEFGMRNDKVGGEKLDGSIPHSAIRIPTSEIPPIDRTYKLFVGGKQARPDQGYTRRIVAADGRVLGEVAEGNRKDVRNAVEAAHAAAAWGRGSGHMRAQILYFIAENLATRAAEFAARVGREEVDASIARLFTYAGWADKWDGAVHHTPIRGVTLAMNEPVGVLGIAAPDAAPLLGFVSLVAPAIAVGNAVIVIPSETNPIPAAEFYTVLETSDVPDGVINVITGARDALAKVLAEHDDVDGIWYFGTAAGVKAVELASAANMKRTWTFSRDRDWFDAGQSEGREFLRHASEVKNIWIPYGE